MLSPMEVDWLFRHAWRQPTWPGRFRGLWFLITHLFSPTFVRHIYQETDSQVKKKLFYIFFFVLFLFTVKLYVFYMVLC